MKMKVILLLAIAIAAALVTQPVRATAVDTLVITENNSTSTGLTAMLTTSSGTISLTVTGSTDSWTIDLEGVSGTEQAWTEPDAAGFVNTVLFSTSSAGVLFVTSDFADLKGGLADDTTDQTDFTLGGSALWVTFDDDGDVAAVPDTGSTLGLLSLSVVALLGATRLRLLQLAA